MPGEKFILPYLSNTFDDIRLIIGNQISLKNPLICQKFIILMQNLKKLIEEAWEDRTLLENHDYTTAIETVIQRLDIGELRVAEPIGNRWHTNDWIKKAVILYFPIRKMEEIEVGPFVFHDKMKLKRDYKKTGVRVVPHATLSMEAKMNRKTDDIPNVSQTPAAHMGSEGESFGVEE